MALVEIVVFLGGLGLVDEALLAGDRFWGVTPHPVWLIVVLVAVQYGTNPALLAALGGSVLLLSGDLPDQAFDQTAFEHLFMLAKLPTLWIVTAVGAGELTMRHRRDKQEARERADAERQRADELNEAYADARRAVDRLEEHIAAELRSTALVLSVSSSNLGVSPGQALQTGVEAVHTVLRPRKFSIAFLHGGQLCTLLQEGWEVDDTYAERFTPETSLFQAIVGEQRRVVVSDPTDEGILGGEGVLAVPMREPATEQVIGMLKIEDMALIDLSFNAVDLAAAMSDWIASAYTAAERHARVRAHAMISETLPLYSQAFLTQQRAMLGALARRRCFPLTELWLTQTATVEGEEAAELARAVATATPTVLRETDLAFTQAEQPGRYVVMLPLADAAHADAVRARLVAEVARTLGRDRVDNLLRVEVCEQVAAQADAQDDQLVEVRRA